MTPKSAGSKSVFALAFEAGHEVYVSKNTAAERQRSEAGQRQPHITA